MLIPNDLPDYHSYLLRFWREQALELTDPWRFSLEDPHSGKRRGFDTLATLVSFLEEEIGAHSASNAGEPPDSDDA